MDSKPASVAIARQPIFDARKKLWGYELFCVGLATEANAAIEVQAGAYVSLQHLTESGSRILVDFNEKSLLDNFPYALPPALAAVKVTEALSLTPAMMEVLETLKSDGYLIAIEGFSAEPGLAPLYQLADILGADVQGKGKDALASTVSGAAPTGASLMAMRVQDQEHFNLCREAGFSLFHGPFFKSPDRIRIRKLTSNEMLRFQLVQMVQQEDPDFARLTETIKADATISLRLLTYLNSAAFHFTQPVRSIQQAVTLLGWRNVKNWLRVLVLTDMGENKASHDLVLLSAQRGLFLESVVRDHDFWGFDPESMHLLGIFSLLDALLGMPMSEIVANIPIDRKIKAALCGDPASEYLPLVRLAVCLEEARWPEAERMMEDLNLNRSKVMAAMKTAVDWAVELELSMT